MERYLRQIPVIGEEGQRRLVESVIGIAGCGGLGTNAVTMLASAGAGHMVLADGDSPDTTNLNRQYVFRKGDARNKSTILAEWVSSINPDVRAESFPYRLDDGNMDIFDRCDIVLDCLDSIESKKALNRYCAMNGKTLVHGGVDGMHGQVAVVMPGRTPCLECILPNATGGHIPSISSVVTAIASLQVNEAIKIITGCGTVMEGMMIFDASVPAFDTVSIEKRPGCPVCERIH